MLRYQKESIANHLKEQGENKILTMLATSIIAKLNRLHSKIMHIDIIVAFQIISHCYKNLPEHLKNMEGLFYLFNEQLGYLNGQIHFILEILRFHHPICA